MNSESVSSYFPAIYKDVTEFSALATAEQTLFDLLFNNYDAARKNQFVQVCDMSRIAEYEKIFSIVANSNTESDTFRRDRILNRLSTTAPFTLNYFKHKLNEIIGIGNWQLSVDYNARVLTIEAAATDQLWAQELFITVGKLKPANLLFINKPVTTSRLTLAENISYSTTVYNYKLGSSWVLGALPFWGFIEKGVVKMSSTPSLSAALITNVAAFTADEITSVLINDTVEITVFLTKANTAGVITIEYEVLAASVSEITNIKLRDTNYVVLGSVSLYIPVPEDIVLKHVITVEEGE